MEYFSANTVHTSFKRPQADLSKSYKHIILNNGLSTLLISDPREKISACSICVKCGTYNDPPGTPGLAHFCEHMVFMGSSEFPQPTEFFNCIKTLGGECNAFTSGEKTCFYYEIPVNKSEINEELGFSYILKVFSSFFKSPLFNKNAMSSEADLINQEHQMNISNEDKVLLHGMRLIADKNHPFHRFGTGTKDTLTTTRKSKIRDEIIRFYQTYYFAENMTLVLKGPQSINQLQKLAIANFRDIKREAYDLKIERNNNIRISYPQTSDYKYQYVYSDWNQVLYIQQGKWAKVRLLLPIPRHSSKFLENVWCNIIGDESCGTICEYLKHEQGYLNTMFVYVHHLISENRVLIIDLSLTKNGEPKLSAVINSIFSYMDRIIYQKEQILQQLLLEYARMYKYNAYFQTSRDLPMFEVSNLALLLHDKELPLDDLLLESNQQITVDAVRFRQETITLFDMKKLNIIVLSEKESLVQQITLPSSIQLIKDPYYNFNYQKFIFKPPRGDEVFPEFSLSLENRFIPFSCEELDKIIICSKQEKFQFMGEIPQDQTPKLLDYSKFQEIWSSQSKNLSNEVLASFQIRYSKLKSIPINCIGIEILAILFESFLSNNLYLAELAKYSWAIYPNYNVYPSFSFTVCGPKYGFKYFLHEFVGLINTFLENGIYKLGYKNFTKAKLELRNEYEKLISREAMKQAFAISILALESGICPLNERMEALDIVSIDELQQICTIIKLDQSQTQMLISGHVNKEFISETFGIINILSRQQQVIKDRVTFYQPKSIRLGKGKNYAYVHNNPDEKDQSDHVYHYIQLGRRDNISTRTMTSFFSYLLSQSMYELRTSRQIGYAVLSGMRYNKETIGIQIYISSGRFTYSEVMNEVDQLLFDWEMYLLNFTQSDLDKYTKVFLEGYDSFPEDLLPSNILYGVPPSQCSGNFNTDDKCFRRHQFYWEKILTGNFDFPPNNMKELVDKEFLQSLKVESMVDFFRKYISIKSPSRSTLSVFISSHKGREMQEYYEAKKTLEEFLSTKKYTLTPIQIKMLLQEYNRDISKIVKHLQGCGYDIKQQRTSNLQQLISKQLRGSSSNEKELSKLQMKCVHNFGSMYQDKSRAVPMRKINKIKEIHKESTFYPTMDRYKLINANK